MFNLGAVKDVIEDDISVCLYDYDLALNDFLGYVRAGPDGLHCACSPRHPPTACHVIHRVVDPRALSQMASCDRGLYGLYCACSPRHPTGGEPSCTSIESDGIL
jgi:hypothetical protein